ncbi:MAG TPA: glycosyltransferase family 4 protein [Gammaproteobacteria bacterium]
MKRSDFNIAIIAPTTPSGEEGGAERFYQGLRDALEAAGAKVSIIHAVSDESGFDAIKASYLRFYDLDLAAFDGVISTKAPSYAVRHPNHVCYLVHTMRVFYDMFDREFQRPADDLREQRAFIQRLDSAALSPARVREIFVIGKEVGDRLSQYNALGSELLYPDTTLTGLRTGAYEHVFLPGRLHRWKRVDLVIKAMQHVKADVPFLIAGTGEDEAAFRKLAGADERIRFLGRVTEEQLRELYANALVVPFVPQREDLGLVTFEAFGSDTPVITCSDSGEPANIVQHDKTGFIVEPDPVAIAERIDFLANDREQAAAMGQAGRRSIEGISWQGVAETLLGSLGFHKG